MSLIAALLIPFTAAPAGAAPVTDVVIGAGKGGPGTTFTLSFSDTAGPLTDPTNFTNLAVTSVTIMECRVAQTGFAI